MRAGSWVGRSARWLVAVGLVVIAGCGGSAGEAAEAPIATETDSSTDGPEETTPTVFDPSPDSEYVPGECVVWQPGNPSETKMSVPCDEPHYMEVTGQTHAGAEPPIDEPYPSPDTFRDLIGQKCVPFMDRYLGHPSNPIDLLSATGVVPSEESWQWGDRVVWCGVGVSGVRDEDMAFEGKLADTADRWIMTPGTCFNILADRRELIPCSEPHQRELTGTVNLGEQYKSWPNPGQWADVASHCRRVGEAYLGGPINDPLNVGVMSILERDWNAGARRTGCYLLQAAGDGSPVPVTGSLRGR